MRRVAMRWFADEDERQTHDKWQPSADAGEGIIYSIEIWFRRESDCWDFIRTHLVGAEHDEYAYGCSPDCDIPWQQHPECHD